MAPLLGLLGTITGMNTMFSIIGEFGFGNPTIMANGISMALEATLDRFGRCGFVAFIPRLSQYGKTKPHCPACVKTGTYY